jgi:CBS domain-containing protein
MGQRAIAGVVTGLAALETVAWGQSPALSAGSDDGPGIALALLVIGMILLTIVTGVTLYDRDPDSTTVGDICSRDLTTVGPDDSVGHAVSLMREKAIRRLPVVEAGAGVGIVSIGDVAVDRDRRSALADISAAPPNV